jgi:outer membrane protein insertion porin family
MLLLNSCSNTKYLPNDESLFIGGKIKITDTTLSKKESNNIQSYLETSIRPKPNTTFLKMRWKLYLYNIIGEPKSDTTKGVRNWVREKLGEPPVLTSTLNIPTNEQILVNQLNNIGYFNATAQGSTTTHKKRTKAHFQVVTHKQYIINEVKFPLDDGDISRIANDIEHTKGNTLLKKGNPYNLETIKNERIRIDAALKNNGYYYFNPDFLLIKVDTGVGNQNINLTVELKWDDMPRNAYERFTVKEVLIFPNYRIQSNTDTTYRRKPKGSDTLTIFNDIKMVEPLRMFSQKSKRPKRSYRPQTFYQAMQLKPGEVYNQKDHNMALNRLVNMGTFKFVKSDITQIRTPTNNSDRDTSKQLRYDPVNMGSGTEAALRIAYFLTPYPKKSLDGDISGFTQNDSRAGSRASISWRNRNTLRGGELFSIKGSGGFEIQYGSSGQTRRPNTYNAGLGLGLNIPRFLVPFFEVKPSGTFVPRTLINLDYNYSRRGNLYTINSITAGWGYNWKEDILRDHKFFPISLGIVRTDTLNDLTGTTFNLSNIVFNGIILGTTYEYIFNSKANNNTKKNNYFISVNADIAGNVLGLINNHIGFSLRTVRKGTNRF